jgi:hypothetical protein
VTAVGPDTHQTLTLVFWNPRGLPSKLPVLLEFLGHQGAVYCGCSESHTYQHSLGGDGWRWDAGAETCPGHNNPYPPGGRGALINTEACTASLVRSGHYTVWHRLELDSNTPPIYIGTGYFPPCSNLAEHQLANKELATIVSEFPKGVHVIFGGDLNAHTRSNGDSTSDAAGKLLLDTLGKLGLTLLNSDPDICTDEFTRVEVTSAGIQQTTIDYVACSPLLLPYMTKLRFDQDQMNSDHKPLVLTITGLRRQQPTRTEVDSVWRIENIVSPPSDDSWVRANCAAFDEWVSTTSSRLAALQALAVDDEKLADVLEWSIQTTLDTVSKDYLGSRVVQRRSAPSLSGAIGMLNTHRLTCEFALKRCMADPHSSDQERSTARNTFLKARRNCNRALRNKARLAELRLFQDIERNQANSKLFWSHVKRIRSTTKAGKSPPQVIIDPDGGTESDPIKVLRAWKEFSQAIAAADHSGTYEEGIYDDAYLLEVETRLTRQRASKFLQKTLDRPITAAEVFAALRALKAGSAPGSDGLLPGILKSAANAVNTSRLKPGNSVVEALRILFNFILDKEVWPQRWSTEVIFPLHKKGSLQAH